MSQAQIYGSSQSAQNVRFFNIAHNQFSPPLGTPIPEDWYGGS